MLLPATHLRTALRLCSTVPPTSPSTPILSQVLLESDATKLIVSAHRPNDTTMMIGLVGKSDPSPIAICVHPKRLLELLPKDGDVHLGITNNGYTDLLTIGDASLAGSVKDAFPRGPDVPDRPAWKSYPAGSTVQVLEWVMRAMDQDNRPHLSGLLVNGNVVATDGYRLHRADALAGLCDGAVLSETSATALLACLNGVSPLNGEFQAVYQPGVKKRPGTFVFRIMGDGISAYLLATAKDVRPVPYESITPKDKAAKQALRVPAEPEPWELAEAIVKNHFSPRPPVTVHASENGLAIEAEALDGSTFRRDLDVLTVGQLDGEVRIGLNPQYVAEALAGLPKDPTMRFSGELEPVKIVASDGRVAVIMPCRL